MANNMKSYLFTLLSLFLLLSHISLSVSGIRLPPASSTKTFLDGFKRGFRKGIWDETVNQIKQHLHGSPPPASPNTPPVEIKGLSQVKQYFYDFGYINYSDPFTDYLDNETISAIETYQNFFNLKVNGELDNETLTQLSFPRCAVPDLNFTYELDSTNNVSWPKGKWFPHGTKVLAYGFLPASQIPPNFTKVFTAAFKRWSEAITEMNLTRRLNFTETKYNDSDIKIGFYNFSDIVEDTVVGGTIVRFQNDSHGNKTIGDMRLDGTKYWVLPSDNVTWSWEDDDFYLETVAMHQIGHLLGLTHSSNNESVMYPYILPTQQKKVRLSDEDKQNIKQVYTTTSATSINQIYSGCGGRFTLFGTSTLLLTTLSLGFVLLY